MTPYCLAFGFLAGKEVKNAGVANLGLQDRKPVFFLFKLLALSNVIPERLALRWVQKYVGAFGGDSSKVTMSVFPTSSSYAESEAIHLQMGSECWSHVSWSPYGDKRRES